MSTDDIWKVITDRNPGLGGAGEDSITLRKRGIKKICEISYEEGKLAGRAEAEMEFALRNQNSRPKTNTPNLPPGFEALFRKR